MRRAQLKEAAPNAAHIALAQLARLWPGKFLLVTQNVDDLHDRAFTSHQPPVPSTSLLHMHGELKKVRCAACEQITHWEEDLSAETPCSACARKGHMRPHIVWFGEMPLGMDLIHHYLQECDLFLSIGTSGNVYPAAGFVHEVRNRGRGKCVELNKEQSSGYNLFHEGVYGPATKVVPEYVRGLVREMKERGAVASAG
jgi:NAD-dependent deacetylase